MLEQLEDTLRTYRERAATPRPPGPHGRMLLNTIMRFPSEPIPAVRHVLDTFGDTAFVPIAALNIHFLRHPDQIAEVLLQKQNAFQKDPATRTLRFALGNGLLTNEGESWRRQRRLCAPPLRRKQIASYADTMVDCVWRRLDQWQWSGERDVHVDMMELTLDIVAETLFGASLGADAGRRVGYALEIFFESFVRTNRSWRRMLPDWVPTRPKLRARRALSDIDALLFDLIRQNRERDDPDADHLLARLLMARDEEDNQGMDDQQVRDEALTMFVAGHETTALALSYALWLLAQNPAIAQRLYDEVDMVLGRRRATLDDVASLTLTRAVIDETLRLNPPAWIVGRQALERVEIGGYTVLPGDVCMMPIAVIHRDGRWFDHPDTFDPDRWLDGRTDDLPRFAYFPFGGGARTCIGNHFAIMEAVLVLATFLQHQTIRATSSEPLNLYPSVTLRPIDGITLHVSPRGEVH